MNLTDILKRLSRGEITVSDARRDISIFSLEFIGDNLAKIDMDRDKRKGTPEVILSEGKDPDDVVKIALSMIAKKGIVIMVE